MTENAGNTSKELSPNTEANIGNWDEDFKQQNRENTQKTVKWMKFEKEGDYIVRLVGKHVKFLKYWKPFSKRVITHKSYKGKDPAWNAGFEPIETFAIHIIDRADGEVKVLEKPKSFFRKFGDYKRINEVNPAGKNAPDFVITVTFQGGNSKRPQYAIQAKQKPAPITEEEWKKLHENTVELEKLYRSTTLEKIQEYWDALPEESKIPEKREKTDKTEKTDKVGEKKVEPIVDTKLEGAPAESDDLFGDDNKEGEKDTF